MPTSVQAVETSAGAPRAPFSPSPGAHAPAKTAGWLFGLPWDVREIGGVSQAVQNLMKVARRTGQATPVLLVPDYEAVRPAVSRSGRTAVVRARIIAPHPEPASLRSVAAIVVRGPASLWRLCGLLRRLRPEAVNVQFPGLWCLTLLCALRMARPSARMVLSFQGSDVHAVETASPLARLWWRALLRWADGVTCCSEDLRSRLIAASGCSADRVVAVYNGIDVEHLERGLRDGRVPPAIAGRRFLLNAATFEHKKGQDVLVRAFAGVRRRHPDLELVLAGRRGPTLPRLRELVTELGLQDAVHFAVDLPHADTLATFREAEVFVLSSRQEPFGIVLLEASYLGTPIVATAVGGVPEVVQHETSALLVPSEDVSALEDAILRVLDDAPLRTRLAANARRIALERFTWEAAFERYRELTLSR